LARFEERRKEFEARSARLVAISVDPVDASQRLATRLELHYPLLADEKGDVIRAYGVWHAEKEIALPSIFVIDQKGIIRWKRISRSVTDRPSEDDVLDIVERVVH
jgi:peroxiredoxin Q/BCP